MPGINPPKVGLRASINSINSRMVMAVLAMGASAGLVVASLIAVYLSPFFVLSAVLFILLIRSLLAYLNKANDIKRSLLDKCYTEHDKSYLWELARTKDRLLGRLIQEGICPLDTGCVKSGNECFCKIQKRALLDLGINTDKKDKITVSVEDACN